MYIVTPKNKTEAKKFAREIKKTGTLKGVQYETAEEMTGFGRIEETEIEPKLVDGYGKPGVFILPQPKRPRAGARGPAGSHSRHGRSRRRSRRSDSGVMAGRSALLWQEQPIRCCSLTGFSDVVVG